MEIIDIGKFTDFSNLTQSQREFQLINLCIQLVSHLEETQDEVAKMKTRQLKLAQRLQALEDGEL